MQISVSKKSSEVNAYVYTNKIASPKPQVSTTFAGCYTMEKVGTKQFCFVFDRGIEFWNNKKEGWKISPSLPLLLSENFTKVFIEWILLSEIHQYIEWKIILYNVLKNHWVKNCPSTQFLLYIYIAIEWNILLKSLSNFPH